MTHPIGVSTAYFPAEWRAALTTVDDAVKRVFLSRIVAVVLLAALCPQFLHVTENILFDDRPVSSLYIILIMLSKKKKKKNKGVFWNYLDDKPAISMTFLIFSEPRFCENGF